MRWILGVGGAAALLGAVYLGMRERLTRPVLWVGFDFRSGSVRDEDILAGVRAALDERDERGGRFRVAVILDPDAAKAPVRLWMPGLHAIPEAWSDSSGASLILANPEGHTEALLAWLRARGLRRVALPTTWRPAPGEVEDNSNRSYAPVGPRFGDAVGKRVPPSDLLWIRDKDPDLLARRTLEARPDVIVLEDGPGLVGNFRAAGCEGPLFVSWVHGEDLSGLDGCLTVLTPLKPPPPRWPTPFAYAGYLATLRFLDALDHAPDLEPEMTCLPWVFDDLRGAPRVYEIRGGRFVPR